MAPLIDVSREGSLAGDVHRLGPAVPVEAVHLAGPPGPHCRRGCSLQLGRRLRGNPLMGGEAKAAVKVETFPATFG